MNELLNSFENAVDALLNADPRNSSKGKDIKEWFKIAFDISATVSHVKEQKQIGNRLSEQFKHRATVVMFVCNDSVNKATLCAKIKKQAYSSLSTVLIMSDTKPYRYDILMSRDDNKFVEWAVNALQIEKSEANWNISKGNSGTISITSDSQYRQYITSIKSKPFLLLAGISGTGKSRIVRELARACWDVDSEEYKAQKPKNFEMVQVKPNWHDSSELIGYVSRVGEKPEYVVGDFLKFVAKAWENQDTPYFLCLYEMNLAPVEQYFAEYLSVIESRKCQENGVITTDPILKKVDAEWYYLLTGQLTTKEDLRIQFNTDGIAIPQNLIVVGTVNMDETTFSFSRKVLDRAMTIEMNEVDLYGGLTYRYEQIGKLNKEDLVAYAVEGVDVYADRQDVCNKVLEYLKKVNTILHGTPFKVAYRTRNEFLLYIVNNLPYNKDNEGNDIAEDSVIARALDEITSMKILSRIEGDDTKVTDALLNKLKETITSELTTLDAAFVTDKSVSLTKLKEMALRLKSGYTSFWS